MNDDKRLNEGVVQILVSPHSSVESSVLSANKCIAAVT
jgi:hypothetical protein